MGAVTPLGMGKDEFWTNIKNGVCGIDKVTRFDAQEFTTQVAAEVKGFEVENYIEKKEAKRMDLFVQYAVAASKNGGRRFRT
ncbi:polyketide synthase-related [Holotrichia oblita]|nr:polyketide synthase-related [Holotrichia oblita]